MTRIAMTTVDNSTDESNSYQDTHLSDPLEKRRASCRYFDNHPRTIHNKQMLNNDHFYREHLKTCHFSPCKPLPAPHHDILPEEPPLRAEVPFWLMTAHLTPVKLRDKLFSSRHIRLVRFLPGHFDNTQHGHLRLQSRSLQCIVYQVSLDDISSDGQPMFAALSYVCGNPVLTQHVRCGEDYVPTTQNLFEALTYVRHEDCSRLLWADGLCINQEDIEERSHQVGLLHQIYSQAHVVIWLGAGDQMDLPALSAYLSSTALAWTSIVRSTEAAKLNKLEIRAAAIAEYEKRRGKQVPSSDIDHIVDARYFTRVWVEQEMFLGKSLVCQLGDRLFSVASLVASMELWWDHYHRIERSALSDITHKYLMPSLRGTWRHSNLHIIFKMQDLTVVDTFSRKQCSDPRDHVYGLSALFESTTAYPVDYSLSVAEVFCDFTLHCLRSLNDLSIFLLDRSTSDLEIENEFALPSWCPSWCGFQVTRSTGVRSLSRFGIRASWHASGERSLSLKTSSPLTITLEGCVVSRVPWCSAGTVESSGSFATLIASAFQCLLRQQSLQSSSGQKPKLEQLLLSMIDSMVYDPDPLLTFVAEKCELTHSTRTLLESCEPGHSLRELLFPVYLACEVPDLYSLADELEIDPRIPIDDFEALSYTVDENIFYYSQGYRSFVTDDGMLGTCLPGTMAGDVVCVLFGGSVPYILRPTEIEGQYLLIGECYVKELMQGEALKMGLREQKFTLV